MKKSLFISKVFGLLILSHVGFNANAQEIKKDSVITKIPFENYDLTWINGQNRQSDFPLTLKDKSGQTILTGVALVDGYFNYNFARPKDNTQTISASMAVQ